MKNSLKPFSIILLFAISTSTSAQSAKENLETKALENKSTVDTKPLIEKVTRDIAEAFIQQDYANVGELVKKYSNAKVPNTDDMVATMTEQLKNVETPSSWKILKYESFNRGLLQFSFFYVRFKKLTLFFRIIIKNDNLIDIKYNTTPREILGSANSNFFTAKENIEDDSITVYIQKLAIENGNLYDLYNELGSLMNINVTFTFKKGLKEVRIMYMKQYKSFYIGSDFEQRYFIIQGRSEKKLYTEVCSIDFHKNSSTEFYINSWNCSDF